MGVKPREILRFAQNDKIIYFFRRLLNLRGVVFAETKISRLKPAPLDSATETNWVLRQRLAVP